MATLADPVKIIRNDGSETFEFKAESWDYTQSNGLVTDSVISALREVIGGKLVLNSEAIVVSGIVKDMDSSSYPNSGVYTDDDLGFESELRRAGKEWGFDTADQFDQLELGTRPQIQGVLTEVNVTEDATAADLGAGSYEFEIEWTYLDAYIG